VAGQVILPGLVDNHSHIGAVAGADAQYGTVNTDHLATTGTSIKWIGLVIGWRQ
jgi:imidazolonepropionase-like amidohydrolase